MAKFLQSAIQRPGRIRKLLKKKPGEKIKVGELDTLAKKAKGSRSLSSAVALAKRLVRGEFKPGKTRF